VTDSHETEARRLAVAVMLAAIDQRDDDLTALLVNASREELQIAVGGLALAIGAVVGSEPPQKQAAIREHLAAQAMEMAAWPQT
jgi:hypothetical protein